MATSPPPLLATSAEDYSAADLARQHLNSKSGLFRSISFPTLGSLFSKPLSQSGGRDDVHDTDGDGQSMYSDGIRLDASLLNNEDEFKDKYEWAVVYENQRGLTIFSIPYYSSRSLLPWDPSPFTIPGAPPERWRQPPITLANYPLPDGTWQWVSKSWMIDMRSDLGEVQHDGFEYNWFFRRHNWRSEVGTCSLGGWVRRRRWVRLMMRPAKQHFARIVNGTPRSIGAPLSLLNSHFSETVGSDTLRGSPTISAIPSRGSIVSSRVHERDLWSTDDADYNWSLYRLLLKKLSRDGQRLDLWRIWVGLDQPQQALFTDLPPSMTEAPPKTRIVPLLRKYGDMLLRSFIYPQSRADFLRILRSASLIVELNVELGIGYGASEVDFWSYVNELPEVVGKE